MSNKWFYPNGELKKNLPETCVKDCSRSGDVFESCDFWREELDFSVNREQAIKYLLPFGAWDKDELQAKTDKEISQIVLWFACCEIKENGDWLGMIN